MSGGGAESIWPRPVFDHDGTDVLIFTDGLFSQLAHDSPHIDGSACSLHFEHIVGLGLTGHKELARGWAERG